MVSQRQVPGGRRAVALLEVVLALAIFFGVAAAVLGGLSACIRSAERVRREAQAADLAVTLLSEMQLGVVEVEDSGAMAYEDEALADWTWEVVVAPVVSNVTDLELTRVEITIRHTPGGYTHRLYYLLAKGSETAQVAWGSRP